MTITKKMMDVLWAAFTSNHSVIGAKNMARQALDALAAMPEPGCAGCRKERYTIEMMKAGKPPIFTPREGKCKGCKRRAPDHYTPKEATDGN